MSADFSLPHIDTAVQHLGINASLQQQQQWQLHLELLNQWNKIHNLTRIPPEHYIEKHLIDSLSLYSYIASQPISSTIIDVGTGAGFPGIPLAVLMRQSHFTLIDSSQKKCRFIQHVILRLQLDNVEVKQLNIEHWQKTDFADLIIARAVGNPEKLTRISSHLLKKNGKILTMVADLSKIDHLKLSQNNLPENLMATSIPLPTSDLRQNRGIIAIQYATN